MRRRPLRTLALTAVAGLTLSGCLTGGGGGEETTADRLQVWLPLNVSQEKTWFAEELVPAFEAEYKDIDVQVQFIDWGQLATRLSAAFAGGTAPDVFGHGNAAAADFGAAGRVVALDRYVEQLPQDTREDLVFLEDGQVGGKQYIMPLRGFGYLLAYRQDLLTNAGLDPADPPATWEELRTAAEKLTHREGGRITRPGVIMPADNPTSMQQAFATLLYQAGGSFLSQDGGRITWNSAEGDAALSYLAGLYQGPTPVATGLGEQTSAAGAQHPLVTGEAAMALVSDTTLKTIYEQAPETADKIAVAPPLSRKTAASFGGAGNGLFISADSPRKDQAWKFIEFLLRPDNARAYATVVGGIPARRSLFDDPELQKLDYLRPFMEHAEKFRGNPNVPNWTQLRDVLSTQIERALRGKTAPKDALDAAAAEAADLLDDG